MAHDNYNSNHHNYVKYLLTTSIINQLILLKFFIISTPTEHPQYTLLNDNCE